VESTLPNRRVPAITRSRIGRGDVGCRHWKEEGEGGNMQQKQQTCLCMCVFVYEQEQASFRTGSRTIGPALDWS